LLEEFESSDLRGQYDAGNQVLNAVLNSTGVGATVLKQYAYGYDLAGNRTGEQIGTGTNGPVALSQSGYNNVNQMTNRVGGSGLLEFAGVINKPATVTVGGNAAMVNQATTNFAGYATVALGTNVVPVIATDFSGNSKTNKYQLVVTNNGVAKTITYDLNGNETSVITPTSTNTYQWDAANRMVSETGPTNQSLFTYDGLGRRVQIVEYANGAAYATNKFIWDGQTLAEQRDVTGAVVTKRFFGEGEQVSGTNYFFTRDHLGSVREVMNTAGVMQARYDYDPYGRMTVISGTFTADFGYAGMYYHAPSGLNLTLYRAYDPDLGRWPNRDPIQEFGGLNLYAYVFNNPINWIDLYGLSFSGRFGNGLVGAGAGAITGGGVGAVAGLGFGDEATIPAGALAGAIAGFVAGFLSDPCFNPLKAAGTGAIHGGLAGIVGVAGEVGGVLWGAGAGLGIGGISGGLATGGDPRGIAGGAIIGVFSGGLGAGASELGPLTAGVFYGASEAGGQEFGELMNILR
jgi:RHS repeat-associated protein